MERLEVPDFVARAIAAQGKTTPDEVAARVASGDLPPPDVTSLAEEAALAGQRTFGDVLDPAPGALVCGGCGDPVRHRDPDVLHRVAGWTHHREAGGANHVILREETGEYLCGPCGRKLKDAGTLAQETLA